MSNNDDWKREMNHMLEMFDFQASLSLRKINGYFETLRRPFNEEFRQYFLKISNQRLELSYTKIEIESWDKQQNGKVEDHDGSSHAHENRNCAASSKRKAIVRSNDDQHVADNAADSLDSVIVDSLRAPKQEATEKVNDLIEIYDSDDECEVGKSLAHGSMVQHQNTMNKAASSASAKVDRRRNGTGNRPTQNNGFRKGNGRTVKVSFKGLHNSKPFECTQCPRAFRYKCQLKIHKKVHINEKSMGVVRDQNGHYLCTHCGRPFRLFRSLRSHITKSHKNDQNLFSCAHCSGLFKLENMKNAHERQCHKRRCYECYLCRSFKTVFKTDMKDHMRLHSGIRPFQCAVCNKYFRMKEGLKYHLDFVHGKGANGNI